MRVRIAYLRDQGIDFLVFDVDARSGLERDRASLLAQLGAQANGAGLRAGKAALAFNEHGQLKFYGTPDLVRYLSTRGVPRWTHTIDVQSHRRTVALEGGHHAQVRTT